MKRVLTVALPDATARLLEALAEHEYRRPRDQASILLIEAIQRADLQSRSRDRELEPAR